MNEGKRSDVHRAISVILDSFDLDLPSSHLGWSSAPGPVCKLSRLISADTESAATTREPVLSLTSGPQGKALGWLETRRRGRRPSSSVKNYKMNDISRRRCWDRDRASF